MSTGGGIGPSDAPAGDPVPVQRDPGERVCSRPGCRTLLSGKQERWCSETCRWEVWNTQHPRQQLLPLTPLAQPLPGVQDQQVPPRERPKLQRMSRAILKRLRAGEATASELQAVFPGARSVRTRISDVNLWLQEHGEEVQSEPVAGMVGEWRYWLAPYEPRGAR